MWRHVPIAVLSLAVAACATVKSGEGGSTFVDWNLVRTVAFDHQCSQDKIVVLRSEDWTYDLDVCGTTRRYKRFGGGTGNVQWLDVTSLYPPSTLTKN